MADVKWIKITTDIFDDEKILLIEALPDAYAIITCWFKLLCFAGKQNNSGVFLLNDRVAYTDKMLATIFRMKDTTVKMALDVFEQFGMVEIVDGVITIPKWDKHQTLDSYEKKKLRDRQYQEERRSKQRLMAGQSSDNRLTTSDKSSSVAISEEDKEEDKDKEQLSNDNCKGKRFAPPTLEEVEAYVKERGSYVDPQGFIDFYAQKNWMVGKTKMHDWKAACRNAEHWERWNKPQEAQKKPGYNAVQHGSTLSALDRETIRQMLEDDEDDFEPY